MRISVCFALLSGRFYYIRSSFTTLSVAMESNAHFLIGVNLRDAQADPLELLFQQELRSEERIMVRAPRRLLDELGIEQFAGQISDYYLQQYLPEAEHVGRDSVARAIQLAIKWRLESKEIITFIYTCSILLEQFITKIYFQL